MAYYNPNSLWDLLETLASQQNEQQQQQQQTRQQRQQLDDEDDYDDLANFLFRPQSQRAPQPFSYVPASAPSRKASAPHNNGRRPVPPPKPIQFQRPKNHTQRIQPFAVNPNAFLPPIDVYDTPEAYNIYVSVPGARKDTTEVHFNPETSQLFIEGEVDEPAVAVKDASSNKKSAATLLLSERETGAFGRVLHLPAEPKIDEDGITAKFKAGVLEVVVPKQTGSHVVKRKIQIEDVDDDELVAEAKGE
ncbi:hypothetical protein D0Z03_000202 [Geotrichum reessii]|nr:hypothetical protein D0Z03_000202 [Galactomyces reessii]